MTWAFSPIWIAHTAFAARYCVHRLPLAPHVYARRIEICHWLVERRNELTGHFYLYAQDGFGIAFQDENTAFAVRMHWT